MKAKRNEWALALLAAAAAMSLPGAVHAHGAPMNPAPVELGERSVNPWIKSFGEAGRLA